MGFLYLDAGIDFNCTTAVASPGVVHAVGHGLLVGSIVAFKTSGALPTGITAGTEYFIISAGFGADDFEISATVGGAAINFTGSTSGQSVCTPILASGSSDDATPPLTGSAATIAATKTFTDGNVTTATDRVAVTSHGYTTGFACQLTTTGTLPAGLALLTYYFLNAIVANTLKFYLSVADALADTNAVDITAAAGGGTHTITCLSIALDGSPTLTSLISELFYIKAGDTGTSHTCTMLGGLHGLTSGDRCWVENASAGTMPTGLTEGTAYFANALTTTTFRLYSSRALAVAGGASDINVSAVGARALNIRTAYDPNASRSIGPKQAAIHLASSSVANRRIFWIKAYDNTSKSVVVGTAPTGLGSGSTWAIGGRLSGGGAIDLCNAIRRGDTVIQNTDITSVNVLFIGRNFDGELFGGLNWIGKSGARRVLNISATTALFNTPSVGQHWYQNLELVQSGASGSIWANGSGNLMADNCKVTDAGNGVFSANGIAPAFLDCEISGIPTWNSNTNCIYQILYNTYMHDMGNASSAFGSSTGVSLSMLINSIIERSGSRAIGFTSISGPLFVLGSTIYRADSNGLLVNAGPSATFPGVIVMDSIFKDNGDAGTEYNMECTQEAALQIERRNVFTVAGSRGGGNVLNWTLDASDLTTDPLFVDPDNGSAASRNFNLQATSPAKGNAFTFLGSATTSYRDLGAVQRQEAGGGLLVNPGLSGGFAQ